LQRRRGSGGDALLFLPGHLVSVASASS
jgi:hypothetical protein